MLMTAVSVFFARLQYLIFHTQTFRWNSLDMHESYCTSKGVTDKMWLRIHI
jgi:hypothetical protein